MSTLIELAVQRLEQLRNAGVAVPGDPATHKKPASDDLKLPQLARSARGSGNASIVVSKKVELSAQAMAAAHVYPPGPNPSPLSAQFRLMKRPLIRNLSALKADGQNQSNLIMVTSALSGEGKTFTATNLAMSIATELDLKVLLVDADVARPSLSHVLGFTATGGLLDILEGHASLPDVLLRTDIEKLSVLPSGAPRARATELLASDGMRKLLDEMAARYADRVIIFDSPPLLLTTEASVLATHMGQIVVVVHAERTPQAEVQRALSQIAAHPVKLLVLNQVHGKMMQGPAYGYGYGYQAESRKG